MSRTSGQSKLKSCVHLTDRIANFVNWMVANGWINWHLTVAKCAVSSGLSQHLCYNTGAFRICVAGCFNCTDGDPSLAGETLRSHIILQSSLANCHPVQCCLNMRVANCASVWVCKCLQLIYLGALHLTLSETYIRNRFSSQSVSSRATCVMHALAYVLMWQESKEEIGTNLCEWITLVKNLRES